MPTLLRIRIHPIKSCRGYDCSTAELDQLGLVGDRRFQVIAADGKPFTQRTHGALARVQTQIIGDELHVSTTEHGEIVIPIISPATATRTTEVWSTTGLITEDCGSEATGFFSALLGETAYLVRTGTAFDRPVKAHHGDRVGFADAFPLLVISEASLADLNRRLSENDPSAPAVVMERFRPNLVITDCTAFAEDTWKHIDIGDTRFAAAGPCERCIMTTVDPNTGAKLGPEPLRTLATYRRDPQGTGVHFGQNLVNLTKSGRLEVGASVEVDRKSRS